MEISQAVIDGFGCYTPLAAPDGLTPEVQLEMFRKMCLIRFFDSQVKDLWMQGKIYGLAHSYVGSEAIAVGVCSALRPFDCITSTHRGHGHTIAKGADVARMMAELFGKSEGYNHGKGGSMHIADVENGMLGATGIVGSGMPLAVGAALASDRLGKSDVSICFHGDGGSNQGVWHESINMAAAWKLPVIFVCENNQFAIATALGSVSGQQEIHLRAQAYNIPGVLVDGFNPFAVHEAVSTAAERARDGKGPTLIEARTLRLVGHFVADDQWYRDMENVEPYWALEPLQRMKHYFIESELADDEQVAAIEREAKEAIDRAVSYALNDCTEPTPEILYTDVYADGEVIA